MIKKIVIACSLASILGLTACSTGSADRYGTALGDITKLKGVYTLNTTSIDEVRKILGTPNYKAKSGDKNIYVYTYKVNYPFEGLSGFNLIDLYSHNKNNVLNEEIEAVPSTSKILALSTDVKGVITDDYYFGYKYIYSKTAKDSNDSYCITALTDKEMTDFVNFSQHEIEAVADRDTQASTYKKLIEIQLNKHFGGITDLDNHVEVIKEDGAAVADRPSISKVTYCNVITCNKKI